MSSARTCSWLDIDPFVEAYEHCQAERGEAVLADYLPGPDHPHYQTILAELVRVDLELRWSRGRHKAIEEYLQEFPQLRDDSEALNGIAYEEYRLRCRSGERPAVSEYQVRFGLDVADWSHVAGPGSDLLRSPGTVFSSSAPGGARDGLELTALLCLQTNGDSETPSGSPTASVAELLISRAPVGRRVLGFQVIGELGRGAKSRVYLAQQADLADRKMVLKVSSDVLREPQLLAQLQHTHIVPIYSVHSASPFQVFCMPYFGATTLADVTRALRQKVLPKSGRWLVDLLVDRGGIDRQAAPRLRNLESMTYVESVLWLGARLAEGLEHAHQRGIVHGDIKPANILISDEGQPLLLDFNLARDVRQNGDGPGTYLGGTLPYMPPEQLGCLSDDGRRAGPQSDLYALGVVLCELLTGRPPYPVRTGALPEIVAAMNHDRQGPLPPLRTWNRAITPAEASILHRCLAPDPARRYSSASQLREDLERHQANLPLRHAGEPSLGERTRKWARRHPRLTSMWAVALLAAFVVGAVVTGYSVRMRHLRQLEAVQELEAFHNDFRDSCFLVVHPGPDPRVMPRGLVEKFTACLDRYPLPKDERWESATSVALLSAKDREKLRTELSDLCFLRGSALEWEASRRTSPEERGDLLSESRRMKELADACYAGHAGSPIRRLYHRAIEEMGREEWDKAADHLEQAVRQAPSEVVLWWTLGGCHAARGRHDKALVCYNTTIALWPGSGLAFHGRGLAHYELGELEEAQADFDESIRLLPDFPESYFNRAVVRLKRGNNEGALEDLNHAVVYGISDTQTWFFRAEVRDKLGDKVGAQSDRAEWQRRRPTDAQTWVERGAAHLPGDPKGALADLNEALRLDRRNLNALQYKAQILSEIQHRTEEAVAVLDEAVKYHPKSADLRASRGVLLARLGRRSAALADAQEALQLDRGAAVRYQVAGIYALTSETSPEDRVVAFSLLALALLEGHGFDLLAADPDLAPLRGLPQYRRLVEAIRKVRGDR